MLNFLHVTYSSEEVLERLKVDVTQFKRATPDESFNPYTLEQRQDIHTTLSQLIAWLKAKHKRDFARFIESYLLQL